MDTKTNPAGGQARQQLTFLTIHNGNGISNPRSREVILALKRMSYHAYVWKSMEEARLMEPVAGMVPLFDTDCVSGASFVEREKEDSLVPEWALELATESCAAICHEVVARQANLERVASELVRRFTLDFDPEYHDHQRQREQYRRIVLANRPRHHGEPRKRFQPIRDPKKSVGQF